MVRLQFTALENNVIIESMTLRGAAVVELVTFSMADMFGFGGVHSNVSVSNSYESTHFMWFATP